MSWKVAEAKQRLSEVIRDAQKEPQIITNRETPVAAVLSAADLGVYLELRDKHRHTLRDAIEALVGAAAEEDYTLHPPARVDRASPLDPKRPSKRKRKRRASR